MAAVALTTSQEARRNGILRAGRHLASQGGYDAVQMRAVANDADVALGTLYRYFPSKEHLLVSIMRREVDGMRDRFRASPPTGSTPAEQLRTLLQDATDRLVAQPLVSSATIRALVSGDPEVAPVVGEVRDTTRELIRTLIGGENEEVGELLEHIWLSAQVGWISGFLPPDGIMDVMGRAIDRLVGEHGRT